jgi:phage gpG-like protein
VNLKKTLEQIGWEVLEKIGSKSAEKFLYGGGLPAANQVTDRTGTLLDSILGGANSIRKVEVSGDRASYTIGTTVPYAALQEIGGIRTVTDKMRRFFWAKYFEADIIGDPRIEMWSALRFKNVIIFPARPYLQPAVLEVIEELPSIFSKYMMQFLKTTIEESIKGTPKAARG